MLYQVQDQGYSVYTIIPGVIENCHLLVYLHLRIKWQIKVLFSFFISRTKMTSQMWLISQKVPFFKPKSTCQKVFPKNSQLPTNLLNVFSTFPKHSIRFSGLFFLRFVWKFVFLLKLISKFFYIEDSFDTECSNQCFVVLLKVLWRPNSGKNLSTLT